MEVNKLELGKADRNPYAQRTAGEVARLPSDDGGHLIASQFKGSGDIDNLVAQSKNINRSGGEWFNIEKEWSKALKDGKNVFDIKIDLQYTNNSLRPDLIKVSYRIEGELPVIRII